MSKEVCLLVNINKLKGKIVESGFTVGGLAEKLHINKSTLYRKLNCNAETLTIKEMNIIVKELNLTKEEATSIFFNNNVA